jgi:hypothetical protein
MKDRTTRKTGWALLAVCLFPGSYGSVTSWGDAEIPVTEIAKRSTAIVKVLEAADLNQDGVIKGADEWIAMGTGAYQLIKRWAASARSQ